MSSDDEAFVEVNRGLLKAYNRASGKGGADDKKPTFDELTDFVKVANLYITYHSPLTYRDIVEEYPEYEHVANWLERHPDIANLYLELEGIEERRLW